MSDGINAVMLQGELAWPTLKYLDSGKALFNGKIKIPSSDFKTGEERFSLIKIVAWEEIAEYMNTLPPKAKVRVSGRIQERSFTNKEGQKQSSTEVVIDGVEEVASDKGENSFALQGELAWPELKTVGDKQTSLLRAKLKIPYERPDGTPGTSFVRITVWGDLAESIGAMGEGAFVKVVGHMQERTWNTPTGQKRVFTDNVVTSFLGA